MKIRLTILSVLAAAMSAAVATPINVTVSGGASVVAAPKSDLGDFGDATVLSWISSDIPAYNTLHSTSLPGATGVGALIGQTGGTGGTSITLDVTGYTYLFLHWGGQDGGWAQLFYVGNSAGTFSFDNSAIGQNPIVGGLSFFSFYGPNTVPDGGSTLLLLGSALSGLGMVVRRFKLI